MNGTSTVGMNCSRRASGHEDTLPLLRADGAAGRRQKTAASADPHRQPPMPQCVQAAVAPMGIELTQRIEGTMRVRGDTEATSVVYLDMAADSARLPVRVRLYCSVNERGEIEHVLSMPRLLQAG